MKIRITSPQAGLIPGQVYELQPSAALALVAAGAAVRVGGVERAVEAPAEAAVVPAQAKRGRVRR